MIGHVPVLLHACINGLNIIENGIYVDATYGGGGHSVEILNQLGDNGRLVAFDSDRAATDRLIDDKRLLFIGENFRYINQSRWNIGRFRSFFFSIGFSDKGLFKQV